MTVYTGTNGVDVLAGGAGNDTLLGLGGGDTLTGNGGMDTLVGGTGDDTYHVTYGTDVIVEDAGGGIDSIVLFGGTISSYTLPDNVENLYLNTNSDAEIGIGNSLDNYLAGTLRADTLYGLEGNDTFYSIFGADLLVGGVGDDTYIVSSSNTIVEDADSGIDSVQSVTSFVLGDNVENLTLLSTTASNGTGNGLNNVLIGSTAVNTLTGGAGNDTLDGGDGSDLLIGGEGDDTYYSVLGEDTIQENSGEGIDTIITTDATSPFFGMTVDLEANVENVTLLKGLLVRGNALNNILVGNQTQALGYFTNIMSGYGGDDTFYGGGGADSMVGGTGNDTYYVDDSLDVCAELASEGTDTIVSTITRTLDNNVENLILAGTSALNGTGNTLNNTITGNSGINTLSGSDGDDVLEGRDGADLLIGGSGNDTASYANAAASVQVIIDDGSGDGSGYLNESSGDVLQGIENLRGSGFDDHLLGSAGANTLWGGDGDDLLDGLGGADRFDGGAGHDIVSYGNSSAGVSVNLDGSAGTGGDAAGDVLIGIEGIQATEFDDTVVGSGGANYIIGFDGNDTLQGLGGGDYLQGNAGNDTVSYAGLSEGVAVVLQWNGLLDDGYGFYGTSEDTLGSFENVVGTDYDDVFYGSDAANTLAGGGGRDTMLGGEGADRLIGGSGDDYYYFQRGQDQDVIVENDSATNTDLLQLSGGVDSDQVWFRHVGNDLEVSIIGTADKITITDWYSGSARHVEQFLADDGKVLLDSQVDNLVSAMSAFSPPSSGQTTLPPTYQTALATVIAANWQ